jgi:D-alanyl-lipoteichoic acid acyltransferase DltB (MBOAT superfamily)
MLFNSFEFLGFLLLVFFVYWFVIPNKLRPRNLFLLAASYFFYACWDYRFLFLLMFSTLLDYYTGIKISDTAGARSKKTWLILSVAINLGFLAIFKYYNFFIQSFTEFLGLFGLKSHAWTFSVILPVGISFYTFHGLSYVFDIYNKKIEPERHFETYGLFVCYFPLLVAGPIERATHLLPQFKTNRNFNYSQGVNGLKQALWGLFKKVVVADNCAIYADAVFSDFHHASPAQLIFGVVLFTFQIYGDFSGYSDMALGVSRLFGVELLRNFKYPYFSRSVAEFWRRWHISLSNWFRDYLYIPLGGSKVSKIKQVRNVLIIFILSGLWHGANWTFLFWGLLNALYVIPSVIMNNKQRNLEIVAYDSKLPDIREFLQMTLTFLATCFAFIFFRSPTISDAFRYIELLGSDNTGIKNLSGIYMVIAVVIMLVFEWMGRREEIPFNHIQSRRLRYCSYLLVLLIIFLMGAFINPRTFIYFQF